MARRTLDTANKSKKDEFYTQYEDVEREVNSYLEYNPEIFKGKIVLCPCDDTDSSSFTKYFAQNFRKLGLKKLISTSYEKTGSKAKLFILEANENKSEKINIDNLKWEYMEGDGDFRSKEVKKLRDEADFIITNPPFSLFREFVDWIMEANKKFLILGNQNAITYKDFFPFIANNQIWLGCRFNERINGKNLTYRVPDHYEMKACELFINSKGEKFITVPGTGWFTNIDHGKRHQPLALMSMEDNIKFSKHKVIKDRGYKKYDNYDAIDVSFVDAIPSDYKGNMGVPITFLGKYCPEQFEIIRFRKGNDGKDLSINGKCPYFRIIIRRKK
jgi:hypothetical protein